MGISHLLRTVSAALGAVVLTAAALMGASAPAHAAGAAAAICQLETLTTHDRPITQTLQMNNWTENAIEVRCAGVAIPRDNIVLSGLRIPGYEQAACNGPVIGNTGTATVTWSDGTTSTGERSQVTAFTSNGNMTGTFTILITSGAHYVGRTISQTVTGYGGSCGDTVFPALATLVFAEVEL
ncbi:hypothetical protein [Streptomyces sp. NPDC005012]|uniref:hypothetical protein n=1 Tax=unclassified Streptomyces TaxID=2593676 RepID=UPI0033BAC7D8